MQLQAKITELIGKTISQVEQSDERLIITSSEGEVYTLSWDGFDDIFELTVYQEPAPEEKSFSELMAERGDLVQITPEWRGKNKIPKGALIGYQAFRDGRITASYPFWREVNNQVQFILAMPGKCTWTDLPLVDNGYFTDDNLYINKEPIIIDIEVTRFATI